MPRRVPVLVVGLGNEYRSDDGVGLYVARRLRTSHPPGTHIAEASGEASELVELWRQADRVHVIDATVSAVAPGTVRWVDLLDRHSAGAGFHSSSHTFGLDEAVSLARALGTLPDTLVAYGIEAARLDYGRRLSPAVRAAADRVCARLSRSLSESNV
jgi:hydrogenase maturation protease